MLNGSDWAREVCVEDAVALANAVDGRSVTLASGSPRRRELIRACGVRIRIIRSGIDEPEPLVSHPRAWARRWALRKALSVVDIVDTDLIWAADTIVVQGGRGMGKPADTQEAVAMLRRLSGTTHQVITGVAVTGRGGRRYTTGSAVSHVRFRRLSRADIDRYVATGEPFDKAGAYGIQGQAGAFVAAVDGPVDNVIGLPLRRLAQLTRRI
ncbi:MAG: septum formation protein Maf [candidate division Zixibacteria bacterium]|nr:septum formation protein Maf [candidate division Zixibacteria bacterium]